MNPKPQRKVDREALDTEKEKPCAVCGRGPSDPAHIKTRGSGGPDADFNVMPLCRLHHIEQGKRGLVSMSEKYPEFLEALRTRGWEIVFEFGRFKLVRAGVT